MNRRFSGKVKKFAWERDKGKCVYCGATKNLEFDHIIPFDKGGSNSERNIQIVCIFCNRKKYNYIDDIFLFDPFSKSPKRKDKRRNKRTKVFFLPTILTKQMNCECPDSISIFFKYISNKIGLFLVKNGEEGVITELLYFNNKFNKIFLPNSIVNVLGWNNLNKSEVIIKNIDGHTGLFLFKKED